MWTMVVEVVAPCRHQMAGMAKVVKQVLIQAFTSHSAVKAFYKSVLHRLSRGDVVPVNFPVFRPFQDGISGQFGLIVADHQARIAQSEESSLFQSQIGLEN